MYFYILAFLKARLILNLICLYCMLTFCSPEKLFMVHIAIISNGVLNLKHQTSSYSMASLWLWTSFLPFTAKFPLRIFAHFLLNRGIKIYATCSLLMDIQVMNQITIEIYFSENPWTNYLCTLVNIFCRMEF